MSQRSTLQNLIVNAAEMVLVRYARKVNMKYGKQDIYDLDKFALYDLAGGLNHEINDYKESIPAFINNDVLVSEKEKTHAMTTYQRALGELVKHLDLLNAHIEGSKLIDELK